MGQRRVSACLAHHDQPGLPASARAMLQCAVLRQRKMPWASARAVMRYGARSRTVLRDAQD